MGYLFGDSVTVFVIHYAQCNNGKLTLCRMNLPHNLAIVPEKQEVFFWMAVSRFIAVIILIII